MRIRLFAAILTVAALAQPAFAAPGDTAVSINVHYADLDVSTPDGAQALAARIHEGAARACGGSAGFDAYYHLSPASTVAEFEACKANAVDRALQALNSPTVSRAYAEAYAPAQGR